MGRRGGEKREKGKAPESFKKSFLLPMLSLFSLGPFVLFIRSKMIRLEAASSLGAMGCILFLGLFSFCSANQLLLHLISDFQKLAEISYLLHLLLPISYIFWGGCILGRRGDMSRSSSTRIYWRNVKALKI